MLGHDETLLRQGPRAEPFAAHLEGQAEQRPVIVVEEIEGHDQRALAPLARLGPQPSDQEVVARTAARVAHDDLPVQQRALRQAKRPQLGHGGQQVPAVAIDDPQAGLVLRHERADAVPLQLEEVVRGVEAAARQAGAHRGEGPREGSRRLRRIQQERMFGPGADRSRHQSSMRPALALSRGQEAFLRALLARSVRSGFAAARAVALACTSDS